MIADLKPYPEYKDSGTLWFGDDNSPSFHARSITTDTSWKISPTRVSTFSNSTTWGRFLWPGKLYMTRISPLRTLILFSLFPCFLWGATMEVLQLRETELKAELAAVQAEMAKLAADQNHPADNPEDQDAMKRLDLSSFLPGVDVHAKKIRALGAQVYKQFVENELFRRFVSDRVYILTTGKAA